ncbi:MAG TPA: ATP-binding protein, partial [Anaerolineae bacterium]|nr:ATP-binding protein [Anaerolineae bacterium]
YKRDLALLRRVLAVLHGSAERDQVLTSVLHVIVEAMGQGFGGLLLVSHPQHPGLEVVACAGLPAAGMPHWLFPRGCPCIQVLQSGLPLFKSKSADCVASQAAGPDPHGCLSIALKTPQKMVGALCLLCPPGFQIEGWDLSLWEDIGVQVGRVVEDAWLNAQVQQERELLHTLYAVSDQLATSLDLPWVLSRVLDLSVFATDARDGSIFMLPSPGTTAARILRRDLPPEEAEMAIKQVLAGGLAGWVMRHQEGTIVADTTSDPRWLDLSGDADPPGSALAVPLVAGGRVLGILTLDHAQPGHFQTRHMSLMTAVAHQASTAVEKARLHDEVSRMAEVLAQRVQERTRELEVAQAQLIQAEKLAALGELAAGIAHEINNPLHVLQAYVEYMASQMSPGDPFLEYLETMQGALQGIARLAGQLRDFSRPAEGHRQPVRVDEIVGNVLRLASKELMHCKIDLVEAYLPHLPPVMGDARQLEQVFLNLILNARDAMAGGGRLIVETGTAGDAVYLQFADTGVGIPAETLPRIFDPYFTTKADRGTGLGLAICQRIVTQHGGKVTVSSVPGEGSTFTVYLPVHANRRPQPAILPDALEESAAGQP